MLLSIIIPCYNVEKYLDNCLNSIYMQNADSNLFEVITVDDGSTDSTLSILENWEKKRTNLKVITKENGGVSSARNRGLKIAGGDYIWFIDSDDYIMPGSLERIIELLRKSRPEIVRFSQFKRVGQAACYEDEREIVDLDARYVPANTSAANVFSCIISRSAAGGVQFDERLNYAEDTYFNYCVYIRLSGKEGKCAFVKQSVYCYRMNPESAMHRKNDASAVKHTEDLFLLARLYKEKIASGEIKDPEKLENTKQRQYASVQGGLTILPCSSKNRRAVMRELKDDGLYPYPIITWPFKTAKSVNSKIVEALKLGFVNELYYSIYYYLRKIISTVK